VTRRVPFSSWRDSMTRPTAPQRHCGSMRKPWLSSNGLPRDPGSSSFLGYRAISYHVIGRLHVEGGRPEQALDFYRKALAIREQAVSSHPENKQALLDCAGSWHRLGEALALLNRRSEAADACRQSLDYLRRVSPADMPPGEYERVGNERSELLLRLGPEATQAVKADASASRQPQTPGPRSPVGKAPQPSLSRSVR
jgi:tetratricopeptide (TPR) repeat protein